jgi:hypothetical protein
VSTLIALLQGVARDMRRILDLLPLSKLAGKARRPAAGGSEAAAAKPRGFSRLRTLANASRTRSSLARRCAGKRSG